MTPSTPLETSQPSDLALVSIVVSEAPKHFSIFPLRVCSAVGQEKS